MARHPGNLIGRPFGGQLSVANEQLVEEFRWVLERFKGSPIYTQFNMIIIAKIFN